MKTLLCAVIIVCILLSGCKSGDKTNPIYEPTTENDGIIELTFTPLEGDCHPDPIQFRVYQNEVFDEPHLPDPKINFTIINSELVGDYKKRNGDIYFVNGQISNGSTFGDWINEDETCFGFFSGEKLIFEM